MPDGTLGVWYQARIGATGPAALPLTWSIRGGSALPPGLTLDSNTGVVVGLPTAVTPTNFSFAVQVIDGNGQQAVAVIYFNIGLPPPVDPSNPNPPLRQADFYEGI
jgi:hypothetical protein